MNTIRECIDAYLLHLQVRIDAGDVKPTRMDHAGRYLRLFAERFGSKALAEAKRHDLTVFLAEHPTWKNGWTKVSAIGAITTAMRWCEDEELIAHNPYRKPRSLRFVCRPREPMSVANYVKIMRAAMHKPGDKWTAVSEPRLVALRHGSYRPPTCQIGGTLTCAVWGPVRVDGFSDGRIAWPYTQQRRVGGPRGPRHLIVTGGLEKALRQERGAAIAHWWGVSIVTLYTWRRALKIRGKGVWNDQRPYRRLRIMNRASGRAMRRVLFFLRRTGARTCEARSMRWADVDWQASCVRLAEHKTVAAMNGEARIIGMDPATLRLLRNLRRQRSNAPDTEHVFLNGRGPGEPWTKSSLVTLVRKYARRAGLKGKISAYALRHLFAVTGIENGVGERQIADQLGHTTTKQLATYARATRFKSAHLTSVVSSVLRRRRPEGGAA